MKFKANTRRRALEYEKDWVQKWKQDKTFEKSVENRPKDNSYVFYDGPPFITGVPHHGTLLSSIVKDAVPRYWTMKGKRVERVWGWDTHGLPAENFVEKQLNITDRRQIVTTPDAKAPLDRDGNELPTITLEEYITKARESMVANAATWEDVVNRVGRWVDFQGAYKTMDKDFMESVWWAFKTLYEKGKIYEGEKVLMYDTRFATPVSKNEVTMDNDAYQTVTDPSVYVKFRFDQASLLKSALRIVWAQDTAHHESTAAWSEDNKSAGQCAITSLLVNDLLGGEIAKIKVNEVGHYFNVIDGKVIDLTREQFGAQNVSYNDYEVRERARVLSDEDTKKRYELLKQRLGDDWKTNVALLAWTTTPWTLPGNTALAVNKKFIYAEVEVGGEKLIVAKDLVAKVFVDEKKQPLDYTVVREIKGEDLVGLSYEPLFADQGDNAHKVWSADYVGAEAGTGIVHLSPIYGEEDFVLAQENNIPRVHVLDDNGYYFPEVAEQLFALMPWVDSTKPLEVWDNNKNIAKGLEKAGVVWKTEYIRHEYPFNPRSKQRIMYRAIPSWFFDVQGSKPLMLEQNENINWFPAHLKHGRFAKNIEQAPDWNLSRDRFWATAMPVWKGDRGTVKVIGSYAELKELSGVELEDYHRPWVDDITFDIDGEHFTRIDKVLDCWFESGSMPFAQFHYPFENKEKFEANYPGDFIVEYIGQVRAWFYYVHTINTALFGEQAFSNVISTGVVAGNDGRKMSKSLGNFTDPNELMDKFSADSLRFLLLSSPLLNGEDFALQDKEVGDVARKLSMVWNMYDFFTMYAEVDGWEFDGELRDPLETLRNPLDIWIVSRLHQLSAEVEKNMDAYNIPDAMTPILPFLDDASNWFVRRSRRRFWKSDEGDDKNDAYKTLHYVLVRLAYILAPFTPFLAEELYRQMTGDTESIHLKDWPAAGEVNELVMNDMDKVRDYVNQGLSLRAKSGLKVRQPLASVTVPELGEAFDFTLILLDELNVKAVKKGKEVALDETLTPELKREGMMREVIRYVQNTRKSTGLNVDDRISLSLTTENAELNKAIEEHQDTIMAETLAANLGPVDTGDVEVVCIDGAELYITLEKQ
ncbi:class I tRNA ligase family protein [Candidatus Saccharibacteria bacterium]|nr:class I tRNA ligase family protein [Candidatus Saccharibacteria bacterium]